MTKAELKALERVFEAEIHNRLPFQSKAAIFNRLEAEGYLQPMTRTYGLGLSNMTVKGYGLTHAGRLTYCASCDQDAPL